MTTTDLPTASAEDPRLAGTFCILAPDGSPARPELLPPKADILRFYRAMRRARLFDDRALVLQRQGRLGVYPLFGGLEATQVGAVLAIDPARDWLAPTYRGSGCALAYGLAVHKLILNWRTHPDGFRMNPAQRILPFYVPIGNQLPHAAGIGLAERLKAAREGGDSAVMDCAVVLAFVGDGGTSEGDFHVGLNFAGVYRAPVVFVIENNGWAISTPTHLQTAAATLASRGEGYGMPAVRVDGNDLLAVQYVTREAVSRARRGEGPTLIESVTYRVMPHTSSDDPSRYRDEAEGEIWRTERDPARRLRLYLDGLSLWSDAQEAELAAEVEAEIREAVSRADDAPGMSAAQMLDHVFEQPTPELLEQQAELRALYGEELHGEQPRAGQPRVGQPQGRPS